MIMALRILLLCLGSYLGVLLGSGAVVVVVVVVVVSLMLIVTVSLSRSLNN
jgi:hypothetical protein